MWVVLNDAFISVVKAYGDNDLVVVRARKKEHLEKLFDAEITQKEKSDYPFRVVVSKNLFKEVLKEEVERIDYNNFKNSISKEDDDLYKFSTEVWGSGVRNFEGVDAWKKHYEE